jgi:hypothetical protein
LLLEQLAQKHQRRGLVPDLIDTSSQDHYRILQNNDYGLVATLAVSGFQEGQKDPAVGAVSIVINKSLAADSAWIKRAQFV